MSNNFGKPGGMDMQSNKGGKVQTIQNMEAVVDFTVVIQLLEIGLVLTLISSLASMISIQRFSPLTILKFLLSLLLSLMFLAIEFVSSTLLFSMYNLINLPP